MTEAERRDLLAMGNYFRGLEGQARRRQKEHEAAAARSPTSEARAYREGEIVTHRDRADRYARWAGLLDSLRGQI